MDGRFKFKHNSKCIFQVANPSADRKSWSQSQRCGFNLQARAAANQKNTQVNEWDAFLTMPGARAVTSISCVALRRILYLANGLIHVIRSTCGLYFSRTARSPFKTPFLSSFIFCFIHSRFYFAIQVNSQIRKYVFGSAEYL